MGAIQLDQAIDRFIADQRAHGRIRSVHSERAYRRCLELHAQDVGNRDPSKTGKRDVMRTLERWEHPNSRRQKHAILRSFYAWAVWEDIRTTNPADQVRPTRPRKAPQVRLTREEAARMLAAADARRRERWAVRLMLLAGLRNEELRSLRGRHVARDGWIWIDQDTGKGGKERWIPVAAELQPVVGDRRSDHAAERRMSVSSAPLYREQIRSRIPRTDYSRPGGPLRVGALRVLPIYVRAETGLAPSAPVETIR